MAGAHTLEPHKLLGKIAGVVVANSRRDLLYLQIGVAKEGSCLIGPFPVDKINESHSHIFMKERGQVIGIDSQRFRGILYGEVVSQMFLDIGNGKIGKWSQVWICVFLYQSAISSYNIAKEPRQLRDVLEPLDFHADLVGKPVHLVRVNAGFFQCVAELGVQHNTVVLGITQRTGIAYRGLRAGIILANHMQR